MRRLVRALTRITAFRIGLFTGLLFAALHVLQLAGRTEIPLLTRLEEELIDLRFAQRVKLRGPRQSGRVVIAAVDEAAIAKFGRFPWDRRDRKSTRLNSSHLVISYAVFCLKKKHSSSSRRSALS